MHSSTDTVHIKLAFNDMILTVSESVDTCHSDARFWMCWDDFPRFEAFLRMNNVVKVQDKKLFGILVASSIIKLRQ